VRGRRQDTMNGSTPATGTDVVPGGRLPDTLIIGAMKCATSSLHQYLAAHPDIAASTPKELDFFLAGRYAELGEAWYRRQFCTPPGALRALESSPNYTKRHEDPGVARRVAGLVPDAKLIYVLRDPLKRIESHYVHSVGAGRIRVGFDEALADIAGSRLVQTSRYWWQLSAFLEHFPAEQIRVVSYERLASHPDAVVDEVLGFIGLDPGFRDPVIGRVTHQSDDKLRPNRLGMLFWKDRKTRNRLRRHVPRLVGSPIERPVWNPRIREQVAEYLAEDVAAMRRFSGLEFSEWSL